MAVLNITSESYEKEVVGSKLPVLLDFGPLVQILPPHCPGGRACGTGI